MSGNGFPSATLDGDLDAGVHFATRDNRRALAANVSLGDPDSWLGGIVDDVTKDAVEVEYDPDGVLTEDELSRPHAHYRVRWACYPKVAWLLSEDPKWVLEEDYFARRDDDGKLTFRPEVIAAGADGAVHVLAGVELPVTCDTCGHLLDGPGRRRDDGRTAIVPVPAGVTLVLAALCCRCVDSLLTPDRHLISWNALT